MNSTILHPLPVCFNLQGHSRPDISFAVSQISRYTFGPKRSHELALEQIGQYLKGTIEKGYSQTRSN
jgi:hypothetical protein